MGDLTADFSRWEFACPCGKCDGSFHMHPPTVGRLQGVRSRYGKPIGVVPNGGGYRCPLYPGEDKSAHREGRAIDLQIPRTDLYVVIKLAMEAGFTGIGVKNKYGFYQLHIDDAAAIEGVRPRPWVWTY